MLASPLGNGRASKATSVPTATVGTHSFYKNERFLSVGR